MVSSATISKRVEKMATLTNHQDFDLQLQSATVVRKFI